MIIQYCAEFRHAPHKQAVRRALFHPPKYGKDVISKKGKKGDENKLPNAICDAFMMKVLMMSKSKGKRLVQ